MPARFQHLLLAAAVVGALALPACHKGPAEKAGERIDNTIDQATKGHDQPLQEGPAQKAGEEIDKATGK